MVNRAIGEGRNEEEEEKGGGREKCEEVSEQSEFDG